MPPPLPPLLFQFQVVSELHGPPGAAGRQCRSAHNRRVRIARQAGAAIQIRIAVAGRLAHGLPLRQKLLERLNDAHVDAKPVGQGHLFGLVVHRDLIENIMRLALVIHDGRPRRHGHGHANIQCLLAIVSAAAGQGIRPVRGERGHNVGDHHVRGQPGVGLIDVNVVR